MSDDEYYADSPYDEFEEMLYDADPAPNLADDLAQHAAYSPVWQDDPVGELEQYHSDWEYYSDDYFDDDPAMLKATSNDGATVQPRKNQRVTPRKGRKRKLEEALEKFESTETKSLRSTIKGTVWAKDTSPNTTIFRQGQEEKVALLRDWRERFKKVNNKSRTTSRSYLERDDSWANELGLADMGLMYMRERRSTQQENEVDAADGSEIDDIDEEDDEVDAELALLEEAEFEDKGHVRSRQAEADPPLNPNLVQAQQVSCVDDAIFEHGQGDSHGHKRRRIEGTSETNSYKKRHLQSQSEDSQTPDVGIQTKSALPNYKSQGKLHVTQTVTNASSVGAIEGRETSEIRARKRKLSLSNDEGVIADGRTASSRGKRIASTKLGKVPNTMTEDKPPALNTRAAKARRK